MMTQPGFTRLKDRRGFSAVEVIAVATIIAVLAVILIPILTKQVDTSKQAAGTDELSNLAKVIALTQAETNHYFRLQDYDNSSQIVDDSTTAQIEIDDATKEVPVTYWGLTTQLTAPERRRLSKTWNGPRTVFHSYSTVQELYQSHPAAFSQFNAPATIPNTNVEGPIYVFVTKDLGIPDREPIPTMDERHDQYPVDQWGSPYLFFVPGIKLPAGTAESIYSPVIYSLGPNGVPGNMAAIPASIDYYPPRSADLAPNDDQHLGTGDDIKWEF